MDHLRRIDDAVELGFGHELELQGRLLQGEVVIDCVVGDLRGLVVADHRRQCRHPHQRAGDVFLDFLEVGPGAPDQELAEVCAAVGHQRDRVGDVVDHQQLVGVHLGIAAGAAEAHGDVVGHDLDRDHGERLGLGRIDLARHDRGAGLVLRDLQFGEAGARAAGRQADVVGDLVERDRERAERARELDQRIVRALHGELVGRRHERQTRQRRQQALLRVDRGGDVHDRRKRVVRRLRHVDVVFGMHRLLRAGRRTRKPVELRAAAGHPHMQGKHVVMLAGETLVAGLDDQLVRLVVQSLAGVVGVGAGLLQGRVGSDHLARIRSLPILKCSSDRCVCAPRSLSAGTLTSPRLSVSLRTSAARHPVWFEGASPTQTALRLQSSDVRAFRRDLTAP